MSSYPNSCKISIIYIHVEIPQDSDIFSYMRFSRYAFLAVSLPAIWLHGLPCFQITGKYFFFFSLAAAYSPTLCAVPSAARVLTVVFGMGTGVSPGRIAARNV